MFEKIFEKAKNNKEMKPITFHNLSAILQTTVDTIISEIAETDMTPYQKPPDEPLTWETNEQLVLRHISHVYKKKFYNSPQALRT